MAIGQEAALQAIRGRFETRDKEFSESQPFDALKWKIVEGSMAMANLRDGGSILVGISQRQGHFEATGISASDLGTYDPDDVIAAVNKYAKPPVELGVYPIQEGGKDFLVIDCAPFRRTPIMCSKGAPGDSGRKFKQGDIFARTLDRVSTTRVADITLLEEILEIAAEKRAAEIITTARRIGLQLPATDADSFARERAGFGDMGDGA